jgi:hypothetical protein
MAKSRAGQLEKRGRENSLLSSAPIPPPPRRAHLVPNPVKTGCFPGLMQWERESRHLPRNSENSMAISSKANYTDRSAGACHRS